MTIVPEQVKDLVKNVVAKHLKQASEHYNIRLEMPTILFTKRGTTAGTAKYRTWEININAVLLLENMEDMIKQTVPHEVAHLVAHRAYPGRIKPHGYEWQSVMRLFGLKPDRCHEYDVANARVKRRYRKSQYTYCCDCADGVKCGPTVHNRIQKGIRYTCRKCKANLVHCTYRKNR